MDTQASIRGHNKPPFGIIDTDVALAETRLIAADLVQRQEELLAAFDRWNAAAAAGISDDTMQSKSADFVKQLGAHLKIIEDARKATKQPVLDLGKAVDGVFLLISDKLVAGKASVERAMTAYAQRRAREEQERIRREAEEAAARARIAADLAAAEAELAGEEAPPAEAPEPLAAVVPSNAEASRITSDHGVTASLRGRWTYEVEDMANVPRHLLMINDAAIKAAVKGGERSIAGLRIFQETKIGVR